MSIGERLREERERLGFTQPAFAALAETTKKSQIDYEKDLTQPKAGYLAAIAKVGGDVQYIVTGVRSLAALAPDETVLLEGYRGLDQATRKRMLAFMLGGVEPSEKGDKPAAPSSFEGSMQVFHQAPTGDIFGRDLVKKKGK
ncbi:XRE family transcriptional regulator [Ralstonia syzygii]|uniref:XRE family transcriptional regulator n=1 Tax=Ralstonia syzygii TaxID=28097 RepID=UPI0035111120